MLDSRKVIAFLSFSVTLRCLINATVVLLPVEKKNTASFQITPVALQTEIIADIDSHWQMTRN